MLNYSVSQLKNDIAFALHTGSISQIPNINSVINRCSSIFLNDIDARETKRISLLANPIFDRVYDYILPSDLKGNKIIDLFPIYERNYNNVLSQNYNRDFDRTKSFSLNNNFTIIDDSLFKYIRINYENTSSSVVLSEANDTSNWENTNTSFFKIDNVNYVKDNASLWFKNSATNSVLSFFPPIPLDISAQNNQSIFFAWVWISDSTNFVNVSLSIRSDNNNYITMTSSTSFGSKKIVNGWNLMSFDRNLAINTGNLVNNNITSIVFTFNINNGTYQEMRLNSIVSSLGSLLQIEYYSNSLFRDKNGNWLEQIEDDNTLINLSQESYNIFTSLCIAESSKEKKGANAISDYQTYYNQYLDSSKKYRQQYKTEIIKTTSKWYKNGRYKYNNFTGRGSYY